MSSKHKMLINFAHIIPKIIEIQITELQSQHTPLNPYILQLCTWTPCHVTVCEMHMWKLCDMRVLFCHWVVVTYLMNRKMGKILTQQGITWVQNLLCPVLLVLLRRESCLRGEHTKRAPYMLIMWKNFVTKLF
jgi:hypothetical protein